jgi:Protein of unknown function (DUF4031)
MTVYVDDAIWNWQGLRWCHLLADDADELHRFAAASASSARPFNLRPLRQRRIMT